MPKIKNPKTSRNSTQKSVSQKSVSSKKYWFRPIRSAGSKILSELIKTDGSYGFSFSDEPNDYVVLSWQPKRFNSDDVYKELSLQHYLSNIDCMPKIKWCFVGTNNHYPLQNFSTFIKKSKGVVSKDMVYIVERMDCEDDLLSKYGNDYTTFFAELTQLLRRLAYPRIGADGEDHKGFCMIDIKPNNLCTNDNGKMYLIDADNDYFIFLEDKSDSPNAITYMLFQVYAFLVTYVKKDIDISETGITKESYVKMIEFIKNQQVLVKDYKHTPLEMLLFYCINEDDYGDRVDNVREMVVEELTKQHDYESDKRDWFQRNVIKGSFSEYGSLSKSRQRTVLPQAVSKKRDQGICVIS